MPAETAWTVYMKLTSSRQSSSRFRFEKTGSGSNTSTMTTRLPTFVKMMERKTKHSDPLRADPPTELPREHTQTSEGEGEVFCKNLKEITKIYKNIEEGGE